AFRAEAGGGGHLGAAPALRHAALGEVEVGDIVLLARLGRDLLGGGLGLLRGEFFLLVGGAAFAQSHLLVPAHLGADPLAAAGALVEVLLAGLHGLGQGLVVGLAADGALDVVGRVAGRAEHAAEQVAGGAQQAGAGAEDRGLERRQVAVAAMVAVEPELVAAIGGQVLVVGDELDHLGHAHIPRVRRQIREAARSCDRPFDPSAPAARPALISAPSSARRRGGSSRR